MSISKKSEWVKTSAWHGKMIPVNAVAGCNDTGSFSDSPCRSEVREREVKEFCSLLRKQNIKYVTMWGETSNIFCSVQYVLVAPEDKAKATELAKTHREITTLFYLI